MPNLDTREQRFGERMEKLGTAAPTTGGPYNKGDIVWNSAPAQSQPIFWQCTVSGSPGTWRSGPNLQ